MAKKSSRKSGNGKFDEKILAYALENAILHDGKAQPNAVLGKLFLEGLKKDSVKEIMPSIIKTVTGINKLKKEEQQQ